MGTNLGCLHSGNIHLNVIADDYSDDVEDALEPFVYELVCELLSPPFPARTPLIISTLSSILQRIHFRRTRHRTDESACLALLQERRQSIIYEAHQGCLR